MKARHETQSRWRGRLRSSQKRDPVSFFPTGDGHLTSCFMRSLKWICLLFFLTTATTTALTTRWSSKLTSFRRQPKKNSFFRRRKLERGRTWISVPPSPCRTDPIFLLWFHSYNFLDCDKCHTPSPRFLKTVFLSTLWEEIMSALSSSEEPCSPPDITWCLQDMPVAQPSPMLQKLFPQGAGQLHVPFLHRIPSDPGTAISCRQKDWLALLSPVTALWKVHKISYEQMKQMLSIKI